ncbi:HERC2-like protein [Mya arenaria]|uniref:HERC2-like protein n=1 Tax=Mya arenaria TaxID=6604 RepID=A0ABY7D8K3_MYAAR|nr:uncharacterized protein LOC128240985 [Mya arenaria]WAQ93699.1 HERC2-like protein [Mya arenaria]
MVNRTFLVWILWIYILQSIHCQNDNQYKNLNRKITVAQKALEREIKDLKSDFIELQFDVELLSLGGNLSNNDYNFGTRGKISGISQSDIDDLKSTSQEQGQRLVTLSNDYSELQKWLEEIKGTIKEIQENASETNNEELKKHMKKELLEELKTVFEEKCEARVEAVNKKFKTTTAVLKRAFKEMKEEIVRQQDNMPVGLDKINELIDNKMMDTAKTVGTFNARMDSIEATVQDIQDTDNRLNQTVLLLHQDVGETRNTCRSLEAAMKAAPRAVAITTAQPKDAIKTRMYRGYTILDLDGEEITNHIDVGSRVIQGKDWGWGNQDGGGAGTVDSWYGGTRLHKQVMITWDGGKTGRANYRVGAYGKYDLYILAEGQ